MTDALIGTLIGARYRLTDIVGRGGMGIVYRAEDTRLANRPCAIKLLLGTSRDPEEGRRFERELNIIARLRSRHVVQVLDTGQLDDGRRFIVMELLEGHTLQTLLRTGGPMPPARALTLARGVLAGLTEAHEVGVVHRDLKPANIFVSRTRAGDEVARVLDFGIAKETAPTEDGDLTGKSMLIGTPKYMAPEQFRKRPADARTDLYAVGLVLYEMLSGAPPFHVRTKVPPSIAEMPDEFRIGWLHVNQPPARLPGVSEGLWGVIAKLLQKRPDDRYPDAGAVLDVLARFGESTGPAPLITGELRQAVAEPTASLSFPVNGERLDLKAHGSRRVGAWASGLAALALVGAGAAWWWTRPAVEGGAAALCQHRVQTEPPGATIRIDGDEVGLTPWTVERPCMQALTVRLEKPGFVPATRILATGVHDPVMVHLDARAAPIEDLGARRRAADAAIAAIAAEAPDAAVDAARIADAAPRDAARAPARPSPPPAARAPRIRRAPRRGSSVAEPEPPPRPARRPPPAPDAGAPKSPLIF